MSELIDLKNVVKFGGTNFQTWKFQMRAIFISNDILDIVEGKERKPDDENLAKIWKRRDAKAMYILSCSMEAGQLEYLLTCETSAEMWKKLSSLHEQRSESNKLLLMTKFHDYKMSMSDSAAQHIAKIENMARQLSDLGEKLSDVTIMAKVLGSLPSKFSAFVTAWDSVDSEKQTLEALTMRLIKEETRLTMDDTTSALAVVSLNKSRKPIEKKNYTKMSEEERRKMEEERRNVECFYCHEKGHILKYCPKKRRKPTTHKYSHKKQDTRGNSVGSNKG